MALVIELKVAPSAGKQQCILDKAGMLKCYLKSPPERGLANDELTKMIAKAVGIQQGAIQIIAGATGRKKIIKINHVITWEQLLAKLGIELQMSIGSKK